MIKEEHKILPLEKAVVLLSGGQDSTTCLYWAKQNFKEVFALGFKYGQRHEIELKQASLIATDAGVPFTVADISSMLSLTAPNALLDAATAIETPPDSLPNTFVPGRNLLFLTLAGMHAYRLGVENIVIGACEADYSGYPDCRATFIAAAKTALRLANEFPFIVHTPLMYLTKAQTWRLAEELGRLAAVVELSHTCYEGDRTKRHVWGYGCGKCPACLLRKKGYEEAGFE